ncbi:basic proline-rich protein-like isoform X8 [Ostrea edulis]|uniref:basic proline-rich protein-like isoform X8 n=1 Tax=Ostrea edulis TaxID=37623 RepID=UPI0024AEEFAA|nr:basic proline-rich protein-like isoform X8 [Ostrea edulis]
MSKTPLPDYSQLARWTVNDVCTWLMENRFGNFVSQFREHGIDGGRFANLKDVDLSQMRCPLNKRTELLKCIRNIPNRDITPPTLQRPVATFTSSRPPIPSRIEDRHPPPVPSTNDVDSGSDDDYEAWDEFDDFDSPDEDYINEQENQLLKKPNSRIPVEPPEPQEDYANYSPEQSEEESSVGHSKNGHSIADSLRHALEQRNRVNQSQQRQERHQQPPEPAIPPRPARPGKGGDRPPPQIPHSPLPPRGGRHGRGPAPLPEPEDQPDYEVPEEVSSPAPKLPKSRPPVKPPQVIDDQPTYEDPDETDNIPAPPPSRGGRRPPPKPAEPPPMPQDMPEDFYEDPDESNPVPAPVPDRSRAKMPPLPKTQKDPPSLNRTVSEPDIPAPPPPRAGQGKNKKRQPQPLPSEPQDSDDSSSSDYEKPESNRPPATSNSKPRQRAPPPAKPPEDDYMAMAGKDQKSDDEEDYEKPDPAELPPRLPPLPSEPKAGLKSKVRPAIPSHSTESGKKLPAGAVPIIGLQPDVSDLPKAKHASREEKAQPPVPSSKTPHRGSQEENTFPPVPTSRTHQRTTQINEGRSLPPTPTDHKGIKPQGRGSVIDRRPPPVPGSEDDIFQHDWYQNVNRAEADEVLKNFGKNGTFLIRPSTKDGQPFTLQIYNNTKVYNLPIRQRTDSKFALGREKKAEETFKTVMDLVNFFKKHTLILAAGGDGQTRLKHSCPPI